MVATARHLSEKEHRDLIAQARETADKLTDCQFDLGDIALKLAPLKLSATGDGAVAAILQEMADETGYAFSTLSAYRRVAAAWPKRYRRKRIAWSVFEELATTEDRFEIIREPPYNEATGDYRWTAELAAQRAGHKTRRPMSDGERVDRIRELAQGDRVAVQVAAEFLQRPKVAKRVVAKKETRRSIHDAEYEREREAAKKVGERMPIIRKIEHSRQFFELIGHCQKYVSAMNRTIPELREDPLNPEEQDVIFHNLDRVQAAADFCRSAVATGRVDMDAQLAVLLREEGDK